MAAPARPTRACIPTCRGGRDLEGRDDHPATRATLPTGGPRDRRTGSPAPAPRRERARDRQAEQQTAQQDGLRPRPGTTADDVCGAWLPQQAGTHPRNVRRARSSGQFPDRSRVGPGRPGPGAGGAVGARRPPRRWGAGPGAPHPESAIRSPVGRPPLVSCTGDLGCTSWREPAWQGRRGVSPAYPIGALDGVRKADEEDTAWPCHARTTRRPDRPQPRVPDVPMPTNS